MVGLTFCLSMFPQPLHLGLFRNDFMMNCLDSVSAGDIVSAERLELKQIEFNTIASSFGGLTQQIVDLHRYGCVYIVYSVHLFP